MFKNLLLLILLAVSVQAFAGIPLSTNFTVNTALPIDDRMSVADDTARDAIASLVRWKGMLVYVVADQKHYTLKTGITNSDWVQLSGGGAGGGISNWVTATAYSVNDVVIQSTKIYQCLIAHTSGVFATDLGNGDWQVISPAALTLTGDVTGTGTDSLATTIGAGKVTNAMLAGSIDLTTKVTGVLPTTNGGTGSSGLGTGVVKASSNALSASTIVDADINAAAAIAYSKLNLTGSIVATDLAAGAVTAAKLATITDGVTLDQAGSGSTLEVKTGGISNAQINAAAGITYGKLSLTGSILNADINASAGIAYSKLTLTGSILNADINASAAIVYSKLASLSTGQVLAGNAGVPTATTLSGGATIGATGVVTLGNTAVTGQPITGYVSGAGTVSATDTILQAIQKLNGNAAAGAGNLTGAITSVGLATSLGSFTSANLSGALTDETGTGAAVFGTAPTISGHPTIEGVTSTGATGTGKFVFDTSPTLVTPVVGVASGTSLVLGGTINANAVADFQSTTKAFMPPRMTTTQRDAIASPTAGMVVYNSTTNTLNTYNGSSWIGATLSADTDWAACTFSSLADITTGFYGMGGITNNSLQCRRQGPNLEMKGSYTTGTTSGNQARIPLPTNYGTIVTQTSDIDQYGFITRNLVSSSAQLQIISTAGLGYVNIGASTGSSNNPITPQTGSSVMSNVERETLIVVQIPIAGWTVNTGSFAGVPQVPGGGSFDSFKVSYGATATTNCTTGTCAYLNQQGTAVTSISVSSTTYTLTLPKSYLTMKCLINGVNAGTASVNGLINSQTPGTTFTFSTINSSATAVNSYGTLDCTGTY